MGEIIIKTHDFEVAKRGLKEFSQKKAEDLEIDTVRTDGGLFGLGDHKVTGYELNRRLGTIQQHLIDLNNTNNKTIKEFGQVYSALEALDKDYIQAILVSIKATEKTSERIAATQDQIKEIIEDQKKTLQVLKKFKQKLDTYAHLGDIDKMWSDCQEWHQEMTSLSDSVDSAVRTGTAHSKEISDINGVIGNISSKVSGIDESLEFQIGRLDSVIEFTSQLEEITHLTDIDDMWDSLKKAQESLQNLLGEFKSSKETISKHQEDIDSLLEYVSVLSSYEHLQDIDTIWSQSEEHKKEIASLVQKYNDIFESVNKNKDSITELELYRRKLSELKHLDDVDTLWDSNETHSAEIVELQQEDKKLEATIENNKELFNAALSEITQKNEEVVKELSNKIKYAYLIGGGALGVALIELVIILLKVI